MEQTPWTALGTGVWQSTYGNKFAGGANCIAVDVGDKKLVVLSPSARTPAARFEELEALGTVHALVATGGHDLGQAEWQQRYPNAATFAPVAAMNALKKKTALRPFQPVAELKIARADAKLIDLPGTKVGSVLLRVADVVYVDELIGNAKALPPSKMFALIFWLSNSSPGLKRNGLFKSMLCSDPRATAVAMLPHVNGATTVAFAHGDLIQGPRVDEVRAILEGIAA